MDCCPCPGAYMPCGVKQTPRATGHVLKSHLHSEVNSTQKNPCILQLSQLQFLLLNNQKLKPWERFCLSTQSNAAEPCRRIFLYFHFLLRVLSLQLLLSFCFNVGPILIPTSVPIWPERTVFAQERKQYFGEDLWLAIFSCSVLRREQMLQFAAYCTYCSAPLERDLENW